MSKWLRYKVKVMNENTGEVIFEFSFDDKRKAIKCLENKKGLVLDLLANKPSKKLIFCNMEF